MRQTTFFILFFASFLAILPSSLAGVETIESKYFFTDETFEAHDRIGSVDINDVNEVILDYDNRFIVLYNGTCRTEYEYTRFCIEDFTYDTNAKKFKAKLGVYYVGPDIIITSSVNMSNPLVGEGFKISITLRNDGNRSSPNITYVDLLPPEIEVIKVKGVPVAQQVKVWKNDTGWQNMTQIFWQGNMLAGESIDFSYNVRAVRPIDTSLMSKSVYFNGIKDITHYSNALAIKTKNPFEISAVFVEKDYEVMAGQKATEGETIAEADLGKEILFITEIRNNALKAHNINVTYIDFYFPQGMEYISSPLMKVHTNTSDPSRFYLAGGIIPEKIGMNTYRWKGQVFGNGSKVLVFKMKGGHEGTARATIAANLIELDDEDIPLYPIAYQAYRDIDVKFNDITLESNFNDGDSFDSGENNVYFTVWLQNPNEYTNITNIKAVMDIPWIPQKEATLGLLNRTRYINIFDGFVQMPVVKSSQTKKFKVNVTYETPLGEKYSNEIERSVVIKPHSVVEIKSEMEEGSSLGPQIYSIDSYSIDSKENYLKVILYNIANRRIEHIDFLASLDPKLVKPGEETVSSIVSIGKSSTETIYKLRIDPPEFSVVKNYTARINISYMLDDISYTDFKEIILAVKPKKLSIDITKAVFDEQMLMGTPASIDYTLKNSEKEALYNITFVFPFTYGFDMIGSRTYTLDRLETDEKVQLSGKERIRPKVNGTLKLEKTQVIFHDAQGNEFISNSTALSVDPVYSAITSPALFIEKNLSSYSVNKSQEFNVSVLIRNEGPSEAYITLEDGGKNWTLGVGAGKKNIVTYTTAENATGLVALPLAVARYQYGGETYYSASNRVNISVIGPREEKKAAGGEAAKGAQTQAETGAEEALPLPEAVTEEKPKIDITNYVYIMIFVVVVVVIIYFVSGIKPKEKGMEFLEK